MIDDDVIVGGETPYISPSQLDRVLPGHQTNRYMVEDRDVSREMALAVCAITWNVVKEKPLADWGTTHAAFMRHFIAGANNDLRILGLPLLSIAEVEARSAHPDVLATIARAEQQLAEEEAKGDG